MYEYRASTTIGDMLFSKTLALFLFYFSENDEMKSLSRFSQEKMLSFPQLIKYKKWLIKKGIFTVYKKSKYEIITVTEKGRKVVESVSQMLNKLNELGEL